LPNNSINAITDVGQMKRAQPTALQKPPHLPQQLPQLQHGQPTQLLDQTVELLQQQASSLQLLLQ
jgi:hypothetical protein